MARRYLNVLLLLSIGAASAPEAWAQVPPAQQALAENAALKYWLAFDLLPLRQFDDKLYEAIDASITTLSKVDESLVALVGASERALRELHRGASLPQCAWGLSTEDGVDMLIPHVQRTRLLGKVSCLRAQLSFQQGHPTEAIDDVTATMTLARHVADPVLVSLLVCYSIESQAIRVAGGYLDTLAPADLGRLSGQIEKLPRGSTVSQAILGEKRIYLEWFIRTLSEPGGKETILRLHRNTDDPALKVIQALPQDQLRQGAIELRPFYDKLAEMAKLPLAEAENASKALMSESSLHGPARPLGQLLLPAVEAVRRAEINHLTRLALFKAGMAVCQDGRPALAVEAHKDPFTGVPFQYEKTPAGFRLQSITLAPDGKPIALEVGRAGGR